MINFPTLRFPRMPALLAPVATALLLAACEPNIPPARTQPSQAAGSLQTGAVPTGGPVSTVTTAAERHGITQEPPAEARALTTQPTEP